MLPPKHIETLAVHAGRHIDPLTGAITAPIHLSTTFERAADGEYPTGFSYSREGNPNRQALEECLTALEGGKEGLAFASGMAVLNAVLQSLEPGDHVIVAEDVYYGLRKLLKEVFPKSPLQFTFADTTNLDAVRAAITPATRLIWCEVPSNPLLKITDLSALAEIAHKANAISICDATFATPVLLQPFRHNIDMVMHSTTKYIAGHSDVTGGALITRADNYLFERVRHVLNHGGPVPSPFDCWLTRRGIDTLPLRVRAASASAMRIAEFLAAHEKVEVVHYPGLPSHPGHALAAGMMSAFGALLSFQYKGCKDSTMALVARTRLLIRATSLGGTHSLIEHRQSVEGRDSKTPKNLVRIAVGLENVEDLLADLEQALRQ